MEFLKNESTCSNCGGEDFHHSTDCFLGKQKCQVIECLDEATHSEDYFVNGFNVKLLLCERHIETMNSPIISAG